MLWKSEEVLFDGDAYFHSLFSEWNRAEHTIDFENYIFDDSEIGAEVVRELKRAHERGVRVRVIVDGLGASGWWQTKGLELERAGIEVRVYHPVILNLIWRRLMIDLGFIKPDRKPRRSLVLRRLNRRNHRKVSIIDGKVAYVGSINVADCHLKRIVGEHSWRDTAVKLEGAGINELSAAFDHTWIRSESASHPGRRKIRFTFRRVKAPLSDAVSLNYTTKRRKLSRLSFVSRLTSAKERIWISNAYLAPPSNIRRRLTKAAKRGVDVRVLVPQRSDVWFMPFIARAYYRPLLKAGVHIYEYTPRFLHAKSLIVDNEVILGTSNLNRRSFLHD
ncbi:MAG: phospholipase D-like domain-containing protein, partial [Bdellovibrionales bacterium]|nr:phospholipase D-like domain-containing protein [Bdellovibrionales bacterium]